ncbi:MAG: T9SS type A sorting domain-containing protein, partial [Bacteroidales bacterium]
SAEVVKVVVKNYGGATVNTPFDVGYSLDNGTTWVKESFSAPINSEQEIEFTFVQTANFSVAGLKQLKFKTFLTGDEDTGNDTYGTAFYVYPQVNYPYQTSFETSNGNWYSYGSNSSWAWGVPSGTTVDTASNGTKAWVTNLSSTYNFNEYSYLESPCFNLTTAIYPVISFQYIMQTEATEDGFAMEYSIDGGLTWSELPANVNYAHNWYDTPTVTALAKAGWSQNQSTYLTVKNLLPADAIGVDGVKFRFVFASNSTNSFEGVAIDQFKVYELPNDLSITALTSPVNACEIVSAVKLTFNVKNIGYRPMLNGQTVPIKVKVDNADVVSETLTLAADFNLNDVLSFETTNNYNLYAAGVHNVNAYTNLTIDDDRTNDTLKTQVTVTGMPGYTLGADIGTTTFPVILDAGAGYTSYSWYELPDVVTIKGSNQTYSVAAEGDFRVIIENANGCSATDDIKVINSDKNVGVTAINNLSNACTHPTPISPEITLKHFGNVDYVGTEIIPVAVMVNGVEVLNENFTTPTDWAVDATAPFTFAGTIDISEKGTYNIAIYTKLLKDLNKTNDTTKITVTTYGDPTVSLPVDTVSSTQGDTLKFGVPDDYTGYLWEQKLLGETSWTSVGTLDTLKLNVVSNSLRSATYRITVTDACGTAEDSVFVNAQDLGVFAIDEPLASSCYNPEGTVFKMRIKNFGQDVYKTGTSISAVLTTQSIQKNLNFNLSADLTPGNMALVTFDEPVMLEVGTHFVNVSTSIDGDPNPDNDFIESVFTINPTPTVNIEPDTLYKVFKSTSYLISPTYSADCSSYLWQDGYTEATYHITNPNYDKYKVIASNSNGCSATDSLILITTDLGITAIKSPTNKCALTDNTPVTITLTNLGNRTILAGTQVKVKTYVNGTLNSTQTVDLVADLLVDSSTDITLPGTIDLGGLPNASIYAEIEPLVVKDVESSNNSMDKTVYSTGEPTVSLGADRDVHAFSETLSLTGTFDTYTWYKNGSPVGNLSTYDATSTGTYSVTVSDFSGCTGSDDVVLTFYVDDISMLTLNTPNTSDGCNLDAAEEVNVTIKNTGTWTIPQNTVFELGFFQNNEKKTENYTLTSPFAPNETLEIPLVSTMDFTTKKTHDVNVWVKLTNDMYTTNDTLKTQVAAYPVVLVSLGDDIISNKAEILDPGAGYSSYLWSTGATTQTITVSTTGEYWVEVSNAYGCSAKDFINYTFVAEPDLQLLELNTANSSCTLSNTETVSVKIKNTGNYVFTTGEQINLELQNTGVTVANETLTLTEDLLLNTTVDYTFTQKVDLSNPSSYTIKVILSQIKDAQSSNNTQEKSITVWGNPAVNLGNDTTICQGSTLTLNAGNTGSNYLWNTTETTRTIEVSTTGLYWVDVTDSHSCTTRDEIQVNFSTPPTVTHSAISPVCLNSEPITLTGGSPSGGVYTGPGASNDTFTPSTAGAGTHTLTYTYIDPYGCSSSVDVDIIVNPSPVIDLGENRSISAPTVLDAGAGFVSYKWQDNSTQQTFTVEESGLYSVTVTDNNGCTGYDEVYITFLETLDVYVSSLVSPTSRCFNNTAQPVTVELTNRGSKTFTTGEKIEVSYRIGTDQPKKEEITFTSNFAQNNKLEYTFNGNELQNTGNYTFTCYTTIAGDKGDSTEFNVSIYTKPNLNLGPDTFKTSLPYVLQSGIGNVSYLWNTGATSASITVSQHGKYWLTVTDANSCAASDTIVIWWPVSAEIISGINAKIKLFPNPVKDELNVWIESEKAETYTLELINPQGLIVHKQQTISSDKITDVIQVEKLTPGMYMLRISTGKGSGVFKVIVTRN